MTFNNLIADVGGLFGLWLGSSLVTMFKLIYICLRAGVTKNNGEEENKSFQNDNTTAINGLNTHNGDDGKKSTIFPKCREDSQEEHVVDMSESIWEVDI